MPRSSRPRCRHARRQFAERETRAARRLFRFQDRAGFVKRVEAVGQLEEIIRQNVRPKIVQHRRDDFAQTDRAAVARFLSSGAASTILRCRRRQTLRPLSGRSSGCGRRRFANTAPCCPGTTAFGPRKKCNRSSGIARDRSISPRRSRSFARCRSSPTRSDQGSSLRQSCGHAATASSSKSRSGTFSPERVFISLRSSPRMLPKVMWRKSAV